MDKAMKAARYIACPLCGGATERRLVAPCDACGHKPDELRDFERGRHTYAEWLLFPELGARGALTLCNICEVDIASYDAQRFGLPPGEEVGARGVRLRARPEARPSEDWVCAACPGRASFLDVVARVRRAHAPGGAPAHRDQP